MALTAGVQLSLELSKVFPIRTGAESVIRHLLQYARDLQKSGSDIVVEEDLAEVLGRGRINPSVEAGDPPGCSRLSLSRSTISRE